MMFAGKMPAKAKRELGEKQPDVDLKHYY